MSIQKLSLNLSCLLAGLAVLAMPSLANAQIVFDFNNGTDFDDGQGIGAAITGTAGDGSTATVSIVDLLAPDFANPGTVLSASAGDPVVTQIGSNSLGLDNPSVDDATFGGGIENRDINDGESIVLEFDVPVLLTELDFQSLDDGTATVTIEGVGTFNFVEDDVNNPGDIFSLPFGTDFIPAGANITFSLSSPVVADGSVRIGQFTVVTSADALTQPVFDFNNETEFDNGQGIGTTMTATSLDGSNSVTASIVDVFAPDFVNPGTVLQASQGGLVTTQIGGNSLGVDNPSVTDDGFFGGAGIEARDFNDGEILVIEFDTPVVVTALNLVSLDDGTLTIDIDGVGSFDFVNDDVANPTDDFVNPFGVDFIPAGADITISFSSPTVTDANVRIADITVSTTEIEVLHGDVDMSGEVNFADIAPFITALSSGEFLAEADCNFDGQVNFADISPFIGALAAP